MPSYPIFLRDIEDLNVLPESVRDEIAKLEAFGCKREHMMLNAQQEVRTFSIYLRDIEDLNVLPESVRNQISKIEALGYKREYMILDAQQQVHHSAELANDDIFGSAYDISPSNDGVSGDD